MQEPQVRPGEEPPVSPPQPGGYTLRQVFDNRLALLVLLFGVTGVLGLPALWLSRSFGRLAKVVLSVLLIIYTVSLVWLAGWSVLTAYHAIVQAY